MALKIIAAISENGIIGSDGDIPWKLSSDMHRFKVKTLNHPVAMGRKTFESIVRMLGKPLPGRENIVLTRSHRNTSEKSGVTFLHDFEPVLERARREDIWVIGGAEVYKPALPLASEMHLTRVHTLVAGDTFFPRWNPSEWKLVSSEAHSQDKRNEHSFTWEVWERK
ncbi:MAG: dihydrofolate reductase [Patescibacteria group bacterium]